MCRGVGVQVITFSTKPIISGEKLRLSRRRRYSSFICDFALLWGLLVSKFSRMVWWYDLWDVSLCYVSRTKLFLRPSSIFSLQEAHDATDLSFDSLPDQCGQSFFPKIDCSFWCTISTGWLGLPGLHADEFAETESGRSSLKEARSFGANLRWQYMSSNEVFHGRSNRFSIHFS